MYQFRKTANQAIHCFKGKENQYKGSPIPYETAARLIIRCIYKKNKNDKFRTWKHIIDEAKDA